MNRCKVFMVVGVVMAAVGVAIVAYDQYQRVRAYNAPLPLTVPVALPQCWKLDLEADEYTFNAAVARLNGYERDAEVWTNLAEDLKARTCTGKRLERTE